MRNAIRSARLVVVATLLLAGGLAMSNQAVAVETPIYNAPPGGGPVTEMTELVGPFTLGPEGSPNDENESNNLVPRPEGAYGVKYASFDLVDENDQPLGHHDVHLHHFVIGAVGKADPACPDRRVAGLKVQPLIGSGVERTPISFPDPYAMKVGANDLWGATWHLMNMTDTPKTFYVKYKLGVQYGANNTNTRWAEPFWADSNSCPAGTTWDVPGDGGPGAVETLTKSWPMPFDGYIVGIGGHVHDGGISITTKHEDGTFLCENLATYTGGMLDLISPCPIHDTITAGELLSVTSRYDNSSPHQDVMGIAVLMLWNGNQGTPPTTTTTTTTSTTPVSDPNLLGANASNLGAAVPLTVAAAPAVAAAPRFAG